MRYTSTLVLCTLAAGQAAAHSIRHAGFHARRSATEQKREEVDYNKVDYSGVKWDTIDWDSVLSLSQQQQASATPTPAPSNAAPEAQPTPAPAYTPAPAKPKEEETATEEKPQEEKPKEEKPKEEKPSNDGGDGGSVDGVDAFCAEKGISNAGKNDQTSNGGIWLGTSDWMANFKNGGSEDMWLVCWKENSFTGMTINVNMPEILIKIPTGKSQAVSFAPKVASACAPMYPSTKLAMFGGVENTWVEFNFGPTDGSFVGTFDVSKNTCMDGDSISAVGSKCTSDMNTCVFECQDKSVKSCEKGYELKNCQAGNGGGGGYDPVMAGVGGGCSMGANSETIDVTFSN